MLSRPRRRLSGALLLAATFGALFSAGAARAQFKVVSDVQTTNGTLFNYSYSVTNLTPDDYLVLTLSAPSVPGGLTNLTAPSGFQISFDPGVPGGGLVSFLEDSKTFSSTPAVFTFDSAFAPLVTQYQAVGFDSGGNSKTAAGRALTPGLAPVPEAGTVVPLGAGLLLLTFAAAWRRRSARAGARS